MAPKKAAKQADDIFEEKSAAKKAAAKAKGKAAAKKQQSAEAFAEPEAKSQPSEVRKQDMSNMVNQFKNTSDDDPLKKEKAELLQAYEGLALRDPKKREIVSKWLSDKTLSWRNEYVRTSSHSKDNVSTKLRGYTTMYEIAQKVQLRP